VVFGHAKQALILARAIAAWLAPPCVVSPAMYAQYAAHRIETKLTDMTVGERLLRYPLAKHAAAFCRMSRFSVPRFISLFKRRTSARPSCSACCSNRAQSLSSMACGAVNF